MKHFMKLWLVVMLSALFIECDAGQIVNYTADTCTLSVPSLFSGSNDPIAQIAPNDQINLRQIVPFHLQQGTNFRMLSGTITCQQGGKIKLDIYDDISTVYPDDQVGFRHDIYWIYQFIECIYILPAHYFDHEPPTVKHKDGLFGYFDIKAQLKTVYRAP